MEPMLRLVLVMFGWILLGCLLVAWPIWTVIGLLVLAGVLLVIAWRQLDREDAELIARAQGRRIME
jgi:hypothetical protein